MPTMMVDKLKVNVFANRLDAGTSAAEEASRILRAAIERQGSARLIVASAPSQNELADGIAEAGGIDWRRITMFHLDEYVGLPETHPASFRYYQRQRLLARVTPAVFHGIRGESQDPAAECQRYSNLLLEDAIDLMCLGIGENGHIAFNDPGFADFADPLLVKVVKLDEMCRQQQVNDGCFPTIATVPREAITLTCPMIMSARALVCVVPGGRKAHAVATTLNGPITPDCPASILRSHPAATLFLDHESAAKIRR
jgi:glucosamine-6-phosphate deaminase